MKHVKLFEQFLDERETYGRLNDYDASFLKGKQIKFPNGKLKYMYITWRGDYKSVSFDEMDINPNDAFTVKGQEKIYHGSRGEKTTSPMLHIVDKKGNMYYIGSQMAYEPIEIVS